MVDHDLIRYTYTYTQHHTHRDILSCLFTKTKNARQKEKAEAKMSKTLFNPDADPSDPIIVVGGSYAGQSSSRSCPRIQFSLLIFNLPLP